MMLLPTIWHRRSWVFLGILLLAAAPAAAEPFVYVPAEVTTSAPIPVSTFFNFRSQQTPSGQEFLAESYSLDNGPIPVTDGPPVIVATFIPDVPPASYDRQYALLFGAYGGTYDENLPPLSPPLSPNTGLITSLPFTPPPNSTFQSIWGASEADIIPAYEAFVYEKPGANATPGEISAWQQAIAPFTHLIFSNLDLLLPWQSSPSGYFSMAGQLYQFSDPQRIGGISAQYQSSFTTAVPEPSSLVLTGLGLAALLGLPVRRRRRAA